MQQQLNEKDNALESQINEIKNYKKEIESHKRGAFEQYLEQKKSFDDFKNSVEKERCLAQFLTDPAIMWSKDLTQITVVTNLFDMF